MGCAAGDDRAGSRKAAHSLMISARTPIALAYNHMSQQPNRREDKIGNNPDNHLLARIDRFPRLRCLENPERANRGRRCSNRDYPTGLARLGMDATTSRLRRHHWY